MLKMVEMEAGFGRAARRPMSRILLLLSLCFFSGCYWYPPDNYGYPSYPPGYVASYPGHTASGYAPDHGEQIYGPYGQPNYHEYVGPNGATSVPSYGQPTYLTPPTVGEGQPAQGYHEPSVSPPLHDQVQPQNFGGAQPAYPSHPDCDSPENPMACN